MNKSSSNAIQNGLPVTINPVMAAVLTQILFVAALLWVAHGIH